MVVAEDQVAVHCIMTGSNLGDLVGLLPTRKSVVVKPMQIEKIDNGKIVSHWR